MGKNIENGQKPSIETAVRTLTLGGFLLHGAERNPGFTSLFVSRTDEFGVTNQYCFAIFENDPIPDQIELASISSKRKNSNLVIVGCSERQDIPSVEWDRFINLFGGPVFSFSPLEPEFSSQFIDLGHNKLPKGLDGKADDLFEIYVRNAFEFIFGCRVVRYGQNRRFEARPDGIVMRGGYFSALYDAKAYTNGYKVSETSIRQFKSYIDEFKRMYNPYLEINAFIVISGHFPHNEKTLIERSKELQANSGVPLVFLTAEIINQMVNVLSEHPAIRRSINWRKIFVNPVIKKVQVEEEIKFISKDAVITEKGK